MSPVAAVDVGTNSVRLLVMADDGTRILRRIVTTRLGYGVDRTGHLDDDALARTLDVLASFARDWQEHGVTDRVRIVATSAVRDATDRDRFFVGVEKVTGHLPQVISGDEEAALAFSGAVASVGVLGPCVVVDIGGGSTELVLGAEGEPVRHAVSLQLGCVRITERNFTTDPVSPVEYQQARDDVHQRLLGATEVIEAAKRDNVTTLIGVAGTATTLGALYKNLASYDEDAIHNTRIPTDALHRLTSELLNETVAERRARGPVQPGREDVLHAGALILREIVDVLGSDGVIVSERDSLDGVASGLL